MLYVVYFGLDDSYEKMENSGLVGSIHALHEGMLVILSDTRYVGCYIDCYFF